jgi:uncharacterized protein (TIGR00255 family)
LQSEEDISVSIDETLAGAYIGALRSLCDKFDLEDDITLSVVSKFPDIVKTGRVEEDKDEIWDTLNHAIGSSLQELMDMRVREGQKLASDILQRAEYIRSIVKFIEERSPEVVKDYKTRLEERIKELTADICIDDARLASEAAFFADKSSITEEVVRLYSHLEQLPVILSQDEPVGRKLDFLVQEMNREINTIGSKANDLIIARHVVDVKSELEKIREQIQNIE